MRKTLSLIVLGIAGCASSPPQPSAPATTAPAGQAESAQTAQASGSGGVTNKDGKVCRMESVTNTRLKTKKVCLTPEEWFARSNTAQDAMNDMTKSQLPEGSR
jgi:hypothetical protein